MEDEYTHIYFDMLVGIRGKVYAVPVSERHCGFHSYADRYHAFFNDQSIVLRTLSTRHYRRRTVLGSLVLA